MKTFKVRFHGSSQSVTIQATSAVEAKAQFAQMNGLDRITAYITASLIKNLSQRG